MTKVTPVETPAVEINLKLDEPSIPFGTTTVLRLVVTNRSDRPSTFDRRKLRLSTAVHKRGTHPRDAVERDEIYDCHKNSYGFGFKSKGVLRTTTTGPVLTGAGDIRMRRGVPLLSKRADIALHYREQRPVISAKKFREFIYIIGDGWLINEYELQVRYQQHDEEPLRNITSYPVSFDVIALKGN